jgi:hypothetical protein
MLLMCYLINFKELYNFLEKSNLKKTFSLMAFLKFFNAEFSRLRFFIKGAYFGWEGVNLTIMRVELSSF